MSGALDGTLPLKSWIVQCTLNCTLHNTTLNCSAQLDSVGGGVSDFSPLCVSKLDGVGAPSDFSSLCVSFPSWMVCGASPPSLRSDHEFSQSSFALSSKPPKTPTRPPPCPCFILIASFLSPDFPFLPKIDYLYYYLHSCFDKTAQNPSRKLCRLLKYQDLQPRPSLALGVHLDHLCLPSGYLSVFSHTFTFASIILFQFWFDCF